MTSTTAKPCTINGVPYASQSDAARALGVSRQSINRALMKRDRATVGEARPHRIPCRWKDKTYPSISQAARENNVPIARFWRWIDEGRER